MSHFGDLLDSEDKLISIAGEDITDPHKAYKIKVFSYKIKSSPDANTSLAIGQDMSRGKTEGSFDYKQKIELKRHEGEFDLKWVATNKDYEVEADWAPKDLNDGIATNLVAGLKMTPKADTMEWSANAEVHTGGFDMGPVKPHVGLIFNTNHKSEHEVTINENLVYEKDINVASSTVINVNDKSIDSAQGIISWKNQEFGQMWFRSNCKANYLGLGWQGKVNGFKTAAELQYDVKKANEGLFGQPAWLKVGTQMKSDNGSSIAMSLVSGKDHVVSCKYDMPIAKNLKITYSDQMNLLKAFTEPSAINYTSGFSAEFKM